MNTFALHKLESLKHLGLENLGNIYWDLPAPALYEEAIRRYEGTLSHLGPLVVRTGQFTGRLPKDKFLVREPSSENKISWGKINRPIEPKKFEGVKQRLCAYLQGKDLFIQNCYAGADGGPYGQGRRIELSSTRAMVKALLSSALMDVPLRSDPIFGIGVPLSCPGVPAEILVPRSTWNDPTAYDQKARELACMFVSNFNENASDAPSKVIEAGPKSVANHGTCTVQAVTIQTPVSV